MVDDADPPVTAVTAKTRSRRRVATDSDDDAHRQPRLSDSEHEVSADSLESLSSSSESESSSADSSGSLPFAVSDDDDDDGDGSDDDDRITGGEFSHFAFDMMRERATAAAQAKDSERVVGKNSVLSQLGVVVPLKLDLKVAFKLYMRFLVIGIGDPGIPDRLRASPHWPMFSSIERQVQSGGWFRRCAWEGLPLLTALVAARPSLRRWKRH